MVGGYSEAELALLRRCIARLRHMTGDEAQDMARAVSEGHCPAHLAPFWSMAGQDSDSSAKSLFRALSTDPLVESYSFYLFFPEVYRRICLAGQRPEMAFSGRSRGRVALLHFEDGTGVVVKPLQSRKEDRIARLAGELGAGPHQFETLEGFIVEEIIAGAFFPELSAEVVDDRFMHQAGRRFGELLGRLHGERICYNDATLSDPEGRSHLMVSLVAGSVGQAAPQLRLIDFGISTILDKFPNLELEEVYNLVRVMPEFQLLSRMGMAGSEMSSFLSQYRRKLESIPVEDILARDRRFMEEGLALAARRLGPGIVTPFREGFDVGYG